MVVVLGNVYEIFEVQALEELLLYIRGLLVALAYLLQQIIL